jgi:hypothetical protein
MLVVVLVGGTGCSTVTGGSSVTEARGQRVEIPTPQGLIVYQYRGDLAASTQPSASGYGATPRLTGGEAGALAGLSFDVEKKLPSLAVGLIFLAIAGGLFYLRRIWLGIVALALAVASFFAPLILAICAVAVLLGCLLYLGRDTIRQLVVGVSDVIDQAPADPATAKLLLQAKQDTATQQMVRGIKGKAKMA